MNINLSLPELYSEAWDEFSDDNQSSNSSKTTYYDYFLVPLNLISGIYPSNILGHNELKLYIMFCSSRNNRTGLACCGHKQFNKMFGFVSPNIYKQLVNRLLQLEFITLYKVAGTKTYYRINIPPVYDSMYGSIIANTSMSFTTKNTLCNRLHFIAIPRAILQDEFICTEADKTSIYVLLKLYRYCIFGEFNMVLPSVIGKVHNTILISPQVYQDINLPYETFLSYLDELVDNNIFSWKKVNCSIATIEFETIIFLVSDNDLPSYNPINIKEIEVLIPNYQLKVRCI